MFLTCSGSPVASCRLEWNRPDHGGKITVRDDETVLGVSCVYWESATDILNWTLKHGADFVMPLVSMCQVHGCR